MTRNFSVSIVLFSCVLALGLQALGDDTKKTEAKATGVKALDEAWTKAILANDLDAVVACYAPDAVLWGPGDPEAKGEKAIRDTYAGLLKENTVKDAKLTDAHYHMVGKSSVGWGHFSLTMVPKAGGAPVTMTGRYTAVAVEKNGKWVYLADHASAEPPPPAKPAAPAKQ